MDCGMPVTIWTVLLRETYFVKARITNGKDVVVVVSAAKRCVKLTSKTRRTVRHALAPATNNS